MASSLPPRPEDGVAERRALKHEGGDAEGHEERDDGDWHEADGAAAEPLDRLVGDEDRLAVRQQVGDALQGDADGERGDEGLDPEADHHERVDQPGGDADQHRHAERHDGGLFLQDGDEHERDDGHTAARQVDAAADDDERHPDGHDADDRDLPQDVQKVLRGEELRGQQRRAREQQHEDDYVRVRQQRPRWCT